MSSSHGGKKASTRASGWQGATLWTTEPVVAKLLILRPRGSQFDAAELRITLLVQPS